MRITLTFALFIALCGLLVASPVQVQAGPAASATHAAKAAEANDLIAVKSRKRNSRGVRRSGRPYANWQSRPYFRPYQYYYWQHYYPYGGPLFY